MRRAAALLIACWLPAAAQPLRQLAEQRKIRIGAAVSPSALAEAAYAETLAREFNQVEPENATKFGPIHPQPDSYNFGPADAVVTFGLEHKMAARGHTLVWHNQNPAWVTHDPRTPEELSRILRQHIETVVGHFAGKIYAWDVVNEAFNTDGSLRSTIWFDKPGIGLKGAGYIEQAFRWAHAADPKALLFYNDYDAEAMNAKADAVFKMVQDFKLRGVPIDGVGLQMHFTQDAPPMSEIEKNIARLTGLGVQVQITELDVRLTVDASGKPAEGLLEAQAKIYRDVTALCIKNPKCTGIQTWGLTDKYSWIPRAFRGTGAALPFDANYAPKPAYRAIQEALRAGR